MSNAVTFGVSVRQDIVLRGESQFDADRYADIIVRAEELGYDHVFLADHAFIPSYWSRVIGELYLDPMILLSHLAARTSRIGLVVSCLVVPYRQPFTTAKAIATLDQISQGRVMLGVVPGYLKEEYEAFRLSLDERSELTDEYLRIMIELWTSGSATYDGRYYSFSGIDLKPKCSRSPHVPIWVGGSSLRSLRRVVDFGAAWHPIGFTVVDDAYKIAHADELRGKALPTSGTTPEKLREGLDHIRRMAEKASRDLSDLQVVVLPGTPDDEEAPDSSAPGLEAAVRRVSLGGPRIVDWLGRYIEAGATGFSIAPPGGSPEECIDQLENFAAEVIPQLRNA